MNLNILNGCTAVGLALPLHRIFGVIRITHDQPTFVLGHPLAEIGIFADVGQAQGVTYFMGDAVRDMFFVILQQGVDTNAGVSLPKVKEPIELTPPAGRPYHW